MANLRIVRAEKTTKEADDKKVLLVGLSAFGILLLIMTFYSNIMEQRWVRDSLRKTPFHSVVVTNSVINPKDFSLVLQGVMIKRRCEYKFLTGYVIFDDQVKQRVPVDTNPEDILTGGLGSRPPGNVAEHWGPWILRYHARIPQRTPVKYQIYAHHLCPGTEIVQSNLFSEGSWGIHNSNKGN